MNKRNSITSEDTLKHILKLKDLKSEEEMNPSSNSQPINNETSSDKKKNISLAQKLRRESLKQSDPAIK